MGLDGKYDYTRVSVLIKVDGSEIKYEGDDLNQAIAVLQLALENT